MALIGSLKYLEEIDFFKQIDTYAGTSVGALLSTLLVLGYSIDEIFNIAINLDFSKFFQYNELSTLINAFGFDKGARFNYICKQLIVYKGYDPDITLNELHKMVKKKLIVAVTNINTNKGEYWSYETQPDLMVRTALRASCCIPILLAPIKMNNTLYIDGGCTIHIPLNIFNKDEVLGINLVFPYQTNDINDFEGYIFSVLKTMYCSFSKVNDDYDIVNISTDVLSSDFNIDINKKQQLYDIGYNYCKDKLLIQN